MNMGPPPGPIPPLPPRFEPQYDPALYQHQYPPNMIRQASVPVAGNRNDPGNPSGNQSEHREGQPLNGSQRERGGGEMFAAFLEADERSRQMAAAAAQRQHQDQLNWPSSTSSPSTPSAPSAVHSNQPGAASNAPGAPANATHWFDMFAAPGSGPTPNPAPAEGNNVSWSSITDDLARILNASSNPVPPPQQPEGSTTASAGEPVAGTSGPIRSDINVGDSSIGVKTETTAAPSRQEATDEAEAEKDAEGEDDVDGGGSEKKENSVDMAVDPPQLSTKADDTMGDEGKKEGGHGDGEYEAAVKTESKPTRGRPRKTTGGSRSRGKAKG